MNDPFERRALQRRLVSDALSHAAIELVFWAGMRGGLQLLSAKRRASAFGPLRSGS